MMFAKFLVNTEGKMTAVSVIVPVYNTEKYLKKCLDSILEQSLKNIEIVCVNDGSKDNSLRILRDYEKKDSRIKILDQKNEGVAYSRNRAINIAEGEYVFFVDADDWIPTQDVLLELYKYAKNNHLAVCGGSLCMYEDGKYLYDFRESQKKYVFSNDEIITYEDYQFDLGFQRFIYSREMLKNSNITFPPYKNYEDPVFFVKALFKAERIGTLKKCVYVHRNHKANTSKQISSQAIIDMLLGMKDNLEFAEKNGLMDLYRTTYRRLNQEARCEIESCLNKHDSEGEVFKRLIKLQAMINYKLLDDEQEELLHALQMIYKEYKKYELIRTNIFFRTLKRILGK